MGRSRKKIKPPSNPPYPLIRQFVILRDGYKCRYCGKPLTKKSVTIDHIIPKSKGGPTVESNLVVACQRCNRQKGNHKAPRMVRKLKSTSPQGGHPAEASPDV